MRMVCISNSNDITVGLRLSGVQSFFIKDEEEIKNKKNLPLIVKIPNTK